MRVLGLDPRPPANGPVRISSTARRCASGVRPAIRRGLTALPILIGLLAPASRAGAHAVPAAMDPAPDARLDTPPPAVVIRFTERVEPRASSLDVLDARGARVSRATASSTRRTRGATGLPSSRSSPAPTRCPGGSCLPTTVTSPAAPMCSRWGLPVPRGNPVPWSGAEEGGDRSRAGWSGWAGRCSWAPSSALRCSVSSRPDGSA